jgi:hypothetical protein
MFFFSNYDTPGPGFDPDAPRATGWTRIWEMISRDYKSFWLAGILNILTSFPFMFMIGYAYATHSVLIALAGGAVCGMIAAPGFYGLSDTLLRSLRDEPGYWWHRYSRAVKTNWIKTLLPGCIFGFIFSLQLFVLMHLPVLEGGGWLIICQLISMCVSIGIFLWALAQHSLIELKTSALLKNSVLLFFRFLKNSLAASAVMIGYLIIAAALFPGSVFLMITAGLWLPLLCCFQLIYPKIDEIFAVEKVLSERSAQLLKNRKAG